MDFISKECNALSAVHASVDLFKAAMLTISVVFSHTDWVMKTIPHRYWYDRVIPLFPRWLFCPGQTNTCMTQQSGNRDQIEFNLHNPTVTSTQLVSTEVQVVQGCVLHEIVQLCVVSKLQGTLILNSAPSEILTFSLLKGNLALHWMYITMPSFKYKQTNKIILAP